MRISPVLPVSREFLCIKFTMYASIFATVVCRVLFAIVLGVWMDLGVIGICLAIVGDWLVKAALILVRYRSRK